MWSIFWGSRNVWSMKYRVPDQEDLERGCGKACKLNKEEVVDHIR